MRRRSSISGKKRFHGICNTSTGRKRFNSDTVELCLWLLLIFLLLYIYLPDILNRLLNSPAPKAKSVGFSGQKVGSDIQRSSLATLSMQVVLERGYEIHSILADIKNTNQLVIPKEIRKLGRTMPENRSIKQVFQKSITEENQSKPDKKVSLKIRCTAPFPIEFVYEGNGLPILGKITSEKRRVQMWENLSIYVFVVILDFEKDLLEERDTGKYICQSIRGRIPKIDDALRTLYTNAEVKRRGEIDIFVPGEIVLLHKNVWVGENDKSAGQVRNVAQVMIHHDVAVDGKQIILPCGVSDPAIKVALYGMEGKAYYLVKNGSGDELVTYDSIYGFRIPVETAKGWVERNLICRAHQGEITREISFQIELRGLNSHVSPSAHQVTVPSDQLPIQVFKCEAEEPLTVKWSDGPPTSVAYKEPTTSNKMYSATFIATPVQFNGDTPVVRFECLRKRDKEVIHTWEWIKAEATHNCKTSPTNLHLNFDGRKHKELRISCCMKHSEASLFFEACSTMLECQVKASLQSKITITDRSSATTRLTQTGGESLNDKNGCATRLLPNEFRAGLVMCTQLRRNSFSDYSRNMELPSVFFKWNDDVVFFRNGSLSKPLNDLIKMRVATNLNASRGNDLTSQKQIECIASSMIFAKGFRWKIYTWGNNVFENVQLTSGWGHQYGGAGVISYKEEFRPQTASYYGVLILKVKSYVQPLLKIASREDSVAHLEMKNKIIQISCEAVVWNDTDVWATAFLNKSFFN